MQLAWESGNSIYASAVSEGGYGIYSLCLQDDKWTKVLEPQPVMIENLNLAGNCIDFTSDLDGRKEYYVFNLLTKALERKTSFRYGAEDFTRTISGDSIILTVPSLKGKFLSIIPADSLKSEETQFRPQHEYFLAESLTRQEKEFADVIKKINRLDQRTVIVVSSDVEIMKCCKKIYVVDGGEIKKCSTFEEIKQ